MSAPTLLQVALECIGRGWHVFPCWPESKKPMTAHGWKDATLDEGQVRQWWTRNPTANVAIATGPSNLAVFDIDHGVENNAEAGQWMARNGVDVTYAVRTGRRDGYGLQLYYAGSRKSVGGWELDGCSGDVKSEGGYVMAAGSIHPDSKEPYVAVIYAEVRPIPEVVRTIQGKTQDRLVLTDDSPITEYRNDTLVRLLGRLRSAGAADEVIRLQAEHVNETRIQPPLDEAEVDRIVSNVCRYPVGGADPQVLISGRLAGAGGVSDEGKHDSHPGNGVEWRTLFHTREETENTPDPEFLISGFLQAESATGLIGPARARKSIVALNVIHSLLTGDKLFGHFEVSNKPERVVYLCPESGKKSLGRRIRNLGLTQYVGDTLFYTSMNSNPVGLEDPALREAVRGSVLFIDTAIRFFNGDENSSQDMKRFGEQCHALIRDGVLAIVLLHHTAKSTENVTLESGRGSGDFGGFLTCCWGTTLDDYEDAYNSQSRMSCVKQRDFQADSFKLAPSGNEDNFFLQYVDGSENARVQVGAKEKAGKAQAMAFVRAHPGMTGEAVRLALAEQGVNYSVSAVGNMIRAARALSVSETPA